MSVHDPVPKHHHDDLTAELQASRVRIVEAADQARRRIERDLHDGAQQRFVSASMLLGLIRRRAHGHDEQLADLLDRLADELDAGLTELRELAHGIHPDGEVEPNLVWSDTVLIRTGETVDILLEVTNPGRWMAHCHIAEHHESGMMFSFDVAEAEAAS